ncbi:uncharacterized protein B0H64DRAFT_224612 [Chaetomium fimeti]|uniref:Diaminohydroxyphosphoribosylamino-pyrimidine deaminase n=1 Tax=Chaetomium fimeti TaxID=1854472 RepID=A0AAE0H9A2_9PEZI|nr:hypothetical protein B0H64DRAFT_224612 [Chaetomium fimeti]
MKKLQRFLQSLGTPMQDAEEETFELFSQDLPSQNLGFIDSRATTVELSVAGRDLVITQSPGVLSSNRAGGTTGAVIWKITPLFATWLASPHNPLWTHDLLTPSSRILELGCGISGLVALLLGPRVARYVLTDQPYVAKLVEQNVAANWRAAAAAASSQQSTSQQSTSPSFPPSASGSGTTSGSKTARRSRPTSKSHRASPPHTSRRGSPAGTAGNISRAREAGVLFRPLDWETDAVTAALAGAAAAETGEREGEGARRGGFEVVVACDCIYNEALVEPFVATCVDLCKLRRVGAEEAAAEGGPEGEEACVCVVGQQLRDPLVFEAWAVRFARSFHTWRVPDEMLVEGLRANTGFVVHVGVLRDDISLEAI